VLAPAAAAHGGGRHGRALAPAATAHGSGRRGFAGLGRKHPSGLGFKRGLCGENAGAMGNTSRGSIWQDWGWRGAHNGGARPWSFGEESHMREGREEEEKGPAMLLTATWSSCGTCPIAESGGAAARRAAEVWRRWAFVARVCEARAVATG
jgi:hypothetical protein